MSGSRRSCPHRHAGRAPAPPGAPASGDTAARTALPSSGPPVPPLPTLSLLCPSSVPSVPPRVHPLSLLCPFCPSSVPPLSPAGWQRGQRKEEAAIKSCGKTFPLFGCFGFFFFVGLVGEVVFPPHFGVCKSSCCKLPVQKPASSTGRAKVLLVWFFSPSRSESAC